MWFSRYRGILVVLYLHAVGLALFGVRGRRNLIHCLSDVGLLVATAIDMGKALEAAAQEQHAAAIRKWVGGTYTYLARVENRLCIAPKNGSACACVPLLRR